MANLYVTVTEEITLPNTPTQKTNVFKTIPNINYVDTRIMNCPSGSQTSIFNLSANPGAGTFTTSSLQYARITNDSTTPVKLMVSASLSKASFMIATGSSFYLSTSQFTGSIDNTLTLENISSVSIQPSGSNATIEYFIATT
jgi:hypothetical protein